MAHIFLGDVLTPQAADAVRGLSERINSRDWRVVGSAAVYFYTDAKKRASEVDVVTTSLGVLPQGGQRGFDYAHREQPNEANEHYAALFYGLTKVDVLTQDPHEPPPRLVPLGSGDRTVPVRDPNFQIIISIGWLARRLETNFGFGPHQKAADRVRALSEVVDWDIVERMWREKHGKDSTAHQAMESALKAARERPNARTPLWVHRAKLLLPCTKCDRTDPRYPLMSGWRAVARVAVGRL